MSVPSWLRSLTTRLTGHAARRGRPARTPRRPGVRPRLVSLEDRTTPSASLVHDIRPDGPSSAPSALTAVGSELFFVADDGTNGSQLWVSDGTAAGTTPLTNFAPAAGTFGGFAAAGDNLFFTVEDGIGGRQLWCSDGRPTGTAFVKDVSAAPDSSDAFSMAALGSTLLFSAYSAGAGWELWSSDGTPGGTALVADLTGDDTSSSPAMLTAAGPNLYFTTSINGGSLWRTDGTATGTTLLADVVPQELAAGADSSGPVLYFIAGSGLWKSNGTAAGTTQLRNDIPAHGAAQSFGGHQLTALGTAVFFVANADDVNFGFDLWRIAGDSGTGGPITKIDWEFESANNPRLQAAGSTLYYFGHDNPGTPYSLWALTIADDLSYANFVSISGHNPAQKVPAGEWMYFTGSGGELWRSDGTAAGTSLVSNPGPVMPTSLTAVGSTLYFVGYDDDHGFELWKYAPPAAAVAAASAVDADTVQVTFAVADAGPEDEAAGFTYAIDWDADGDVDETVSATPGNGAGVTLTHDYGQAGPFTAIVTATDTHGTTSPALLAVLGRAAADTITIAAGTNPGEVQVTLTAGGAPADYTAAGVHVSGFEGDDTFTVTAAPTAGVVVDGQDGSDTYAVDFGSLLGTVNFTDTGTAGTDVLNINGTTLNETLNKQSGFVRWKATGEASYRQRVEFDGIDGTITLNAGAGNDTVNDPNSGNFVVLGGPGDDVIVIADTVGSGVTADGGDGSDIYVVDAANLQGPVAITDTGSTGTDGVTVEGTPAADTITQSGNQVVANGGTITLVAGVDALAVDGGGGTDEFTVESPPTIPTTVEGVSDSEIAATADADFIRLTAGANPGEVVVRVNGVVIGTYQPTGRMIVRGLGGNDDIQVATDIVVPVWLYGGDGCDELHAGGGNDHLFGEAGNDRLFARIGDDELDGGADNDELRAGTGSDIARGGDGCDELWGGTGNDALYGDGGNDILRGGGGCDRLDGGDGNDELRAGTGGDTLLGGTGSDTMKGGQGSDWMDGGDGNDRLDGMAGDDVMLGGDGDDLLMGGAGRDLQIGGRGADRIEGNSDEDILIAGYTLFDANATALSAILTEWTSGNSYATRVANITGGTGLTQGFRLWADDGALKSVFDDDDHDVLCGGSGIDWFFANVNGPGVLDAIRDLRANELWTDTDF